MIALAVMDKILDFMSNIYSPAMAVAGIVTIFMSKIGRAHV